MNFSTLQNWYAGLAPRGRGFVPRPAVARAGPSAAPM